MWGSATTCCSCRCSLYNCLVLLTLGSLTVVVKLPHTCSTTTHALKLKVVGHFLLVSAPIPHCYKVSSCGMGSLHPSIPPQQCVSQVGHNPMSATMVLLQAACSVVCARCAGQTTQTKGGCAAPRVQHSANITKKMVSVCWSVGLVLNW